MTTDRSSPSEQSPAPRKSAPSFTLATAILVAVVLGSAIVLGPHRLPSAGDGAGSVTTHRAFDGAVPSAAPASTIPATGDTDPATQRLLQPAVGMPEHG